MRGQPLHQVVHGGDLFRLGALPAIEPAAHLALQETGGLTQRDQAVLLDVDRV